MGTGYRYGYIAVRKAVNLATHDEIRCDETYRVKRLFLGFVLLFT